MNDIVQVRTNISMKERMIYFFNFYLFYMKNINTTKPKRRTNTTRKSVSALLLAGTLLGGCNKAQLRYNHEDQARHGLEVSGNTGSHMNMYGRLAALFGLLVTVADAEAMAMNDIRRKHLTDGSDNVCPNIFQYGQQMSSKREKNPVLKIQIDNIPKSKIKAAGLEEEYDSIMSQMEALTKQVKNFYEVKLPKYERRQPFDKVQYAKVRKNLIAYQKLLNKSLRLIDKANGKKPRNVDIIKRQIAMVGDHVPSMVIVHEEIAKTPKQKQAVKKYMNKRLKTKVNLIQEEIAHYRKQKARRLGCWKSKDAKITELKEEMIKGAIKDAIEAVKEDRVIVAKKKREELLNYANRIVDQIINFSEQESELQEEVKEMQKHKEKIKKNKKKRKNMNESQKIEFQANSIKENARLIGNLLKHLGMKNEVKINIIQKLEEVKNAIHQQMQNNFNAKSIEQIQKEEIEGESTSQALEIPMASKKNLNDINKAKKEYDENKGKFELEQKISEIYSALYSELAARKDSEVRDEDIYKEIIGAVRKKLLPQSIQPGNNVTEKDIDSYFKGCFKEKDELQDVKDKVIKSRKDTDAIRNALNEIFKCLDQEFGERKENGNKLIGIRKVYETKIQELCTMIYNGYASLIFKIQTEDQGFTKDKMKDISNAHNWDMKEVDLRNKVFERVKREIVSRETMIKGICENRKQPFDSKTKKQLRKILESSPEIGIYSCYNMKYKHKSLKMKDINITSDTVSCFNAELKYNQKIDDWRHYSQSKNNNSNQSTRHILWPVLEVNFLDGEVAVSLVGGKPIISGVIGTNSLVDKDLRKIFRATQTEIVINREDVRKAIARGYSKNLEVYNQWRKIARMKPLAAKVKKDEEGNVIGKDRYGCTEVTLIRAIEEHGASMIKGIKDREHSKKRSKSLNDKKEGTVHKGKIYLKMYGQLAPCQRSCQGLVFKMLEDINVKKHLLEKLTLCSSEDSVTMEKCSDIANEFAIQYMILQKGSESSIAKDIVSKPLSFEGIKNQCPDAL